MQKTKNVFQEDLDLSVFPPTSWAKWKDILAREGREIPSWFYDPSLPLEAYYHIDNSCLGNLLSVQDYYSTPTAAYSFQDQIYLPSWVSWDELSPSLFMDSGLCLDVEVWEDLRTSSVKRNRLREILEGISHRNRFSLSFRGRVDSSSAQDFRDAIPLVGGGSYIWSPDILAFLSLAEREGCRDLCIDLSDLHHMGASPHQDLAWAVKKLSWVLSQARHMEEIRSFLRRLFVVFPLGRDFFHGIAKLRAFRQLSFKVLGAYGIKGTIPIMTIPSMKTQSARDVQTNILRGTQAAMVSVLGRADIGIGLPFDIKREDANISFSARILAQLHPLLRHEARVNIFKEDPVPGSYFLESLIMSLAKKGWESFQDMEKEKSIERAEEKLKKGVRAHPIPGISMVGVDEFISPHEPPISLKKEVSTQSYLGSPCDLRRKEELLQRKHEAS
ncbi:MAG: methylmalonyl-CoA mutase family protein [Cytophagales bacterium]|nr:methylmalonyl-CoA mutase family protein [Cytophagales bacterium]